MSWALVTGGSGAIGGAVAVRLAAAGHDVALHTFRDVEGADAIAGKVRAEGREALVVRAHLGKDGAAAALAEEVGTATGGVEILVSNAASGVLRPVTELTERHLDWALDVNARPLLGLTVGLRPRSCVALTSPGSTRVLPAYAGVGASKAALEALVRYLAVELAPATQVNAICAGVVDTPALDHFPDRDALLADGRDRTPMGRLVTPDDVASAVVYLTAPESSMITGHTLVLDGGRSLIL